MDIRVLQYFLTVAREESITRAAEALRMTQLTEDGMLLRKRAEEMIDLMEKTKAELAGSDENINGEIYIGGGETDAMSLLAQTAGKLQKKHPMVHYHIYSGDAEIVMEKLDKGLIDFGLLVGPFSCGRTVHWRRKTLYAPGTYGTNR